VEGFKISLIKRIDRFEYEFPSKLLDEANIKQVTTLLSWDDVDDDLTKAEWYDTGWYHPVIVSYEGQISNMKVKIFSTVEMAHGEMSLEYSWFYKVTFRDIGNRNIYFYWRTIEETILDTIIDIIIDNNIKIDLNQKDEVVLKDMVKIGLENQDVFEKKIKKKFEENIKRWLKGREENLVQEINKIKKVDKTQI